MPVSAAERNELYLSRFQNKLLSNLERPEHFMYFLRQSSPETAQIAASIIPDVPAYSTPAGYLAAFANYLAPAAIVCIDCYQGAKSWIEAVQTLRKGKGSWQNPRFQVDLPPWLQGAKKQFYDLAIAYWLLELPPGSPPQPPYGMHLGKISAAGLLKLLEENTRL